MSLRSRSTHPGAHFTDKANTVFEWFKISSTSWLAGPALFCSRGVGQGNDLPSECLEYQLPDAGWFSGRSSALGGARLALWAPLRTPHPQRQTRDDQPPTRERCPCVQTPGTSSHQGASDTGTAQPRPPALLRPARGAGGQRAAEPGAGRRALRGPGRPGPLTCWEESHAPAGRQLGVPPAPPQPLGL